MSPQVTYGLLEPFAHGRAFPELAALPNPAAGAGLLYKVGGAYWERPLFLTFTLTTSAAAANRAVVLELVDQDLRVVSAIAAAAVQTASLVRVYSYLHNVNQPVGPIGGVYTAPLPRTFIRPVWALRARIDAVQAADQISLATIYRERFETGPEGYPIGAGDESAAVAAREREGD